MSPDRRAPDGGRASPAAVAAWVVLALLAAALCGVAIAFDDLTGANPVDSFSAFALPLAAMALVTGTVGLVIRLRRPANRVGALMAYGPILMLSAFTAYAVGAWRMITDGPDDVLGGLAAAWGAAAVIPGIFVTFPAVALVFPDGRLPGPRWRALAAVLVLVVAAGSALTLVAPAAAGEFLPLNPLAIPGVPVEVGAVSTAVSTLALVAVVVLAVAAVTVRFRRSHGIERQQLKWLVFSVAVGGLLFPLSFATDLGPAGLIDVASVVAVGFVPVTIGLAILRYRLYEIDRIISRTLGWALVTGLLVAVFVAGVVALQALLSGFLQGRTLAVAASTLVAFALFQPLRRRVQHAVDRRFDRARYDGERVVAEFGERLRVETDLATLAAQVGRVAGETVRPSSAAVWLRKVPISAPDSGS